ncbi:hypothetical protein [Streptomyces genisteinicus]|uniref:Uncharacterized protein n=1 Tax=Streptomyces genisteinicus TaxID=2768068 RepID=A0A7H0I150_9ACTN|nr:hypothetical protein [Streptomyces genisteinicus]QNP66516.1 hypothetical protein IAG43_28700 [Streptomyces genisteinicus]
MDEVRSRLREAAVSHRPDREAMLARVERGMTAPPVRPPRAAPAPWLRVVAATAAVAGVLAVGGYAVATLTDAPAPRESAARPAPLQPAPERPADGFLSSSAVVDPHSNRYWAQNNLDLTTREPLTELTVEVRVALTGGVEETGHWGTRPADDFDVRVQERDGALLYRWTLREGRTLPAGKHVFAAQYNHAEGDRDASRDAYTARGRAGDTGVAVSGRFTRAPG